MAVGTNIEDIGEGTDFYFCCTAHVDQYIDLLYFRATKSYSTLREDVFGLSFPWFFLSYLIMELYHINNTVSSEHCCLSAFNLWFVDAEGDDLTVTGNSGVNAAAFDASWNQISWNGGITQWLRLDGTSGSSSTPWKEERKMLRTMPSWVLNISRKRDPTTSLGIPVPGLGHFHNKELINFYYFKLVFFLHLSRFSCILICAYFLLSFHWVLLTRIQLCLFFLPPLYFFVIRIRIPSVGSYKEVLPLSPTTMS